MSYEFIRYELQGPAAIITLDRPEKLNAYTPAMRIEFQAALRAAEQDDAVHAVIVTGAGRGFCSGIDFATIGQPVTELPDDPYPDLPGEGKAVMELWDLAKPVIAAINGVAIGLGAALTLPMDIRLAADTARIGFVFTRLGFAPEMATGWFLPKLVGPARATEWLLTGRTFDAAEALAGGLVSEVLQPDALMPRALALAEEFARAAPASVAIARRMCQRFPAFDGPAAALRRDGPIVRARLSHADAQEAMAARVEKRPPIFRDRASQDLLTSLGL